MVFLLAFVFSLGVDLPRIDIEQEARHVAERNVLLVDGIRLERPFLSISMKLETTTEYEYVRDNEILNLNDMVHFVFPISQHGEIIGTIAVRWADSMLTTVSRAKPMPEVYFEFLELRNNAAPEKEFVIFRIVWVGMFAVAHEDFRATDIYPLDAAAREIFTGVLTKDSIFGHFESIDDAGPKIKAMCRFRREEREERIPERQRDAVDEPSN